MSLAKIALVSALLVSIFCTNFSHAAQGYQITALSVHNQYRQKHHAPQLVMDEALNTAAVKCAQYYAEKRAIDHSCPHKNGAGENMKTNTGWTPAQFATIGTKIWYDEVKQYKFDQPGFSESTEQFTQLVWKSSTKFGFGVFNLKGYSVGVGLYSPNGNVRGEVSHYHQNVLQA